MEPVSAATAASPPSPAKNYEMALTFAAMGFLEAATKALGNVTTRAPGHAPAWRRLEDLLRLAGRDQDADAAHAAAARAVDQVANWPPAQDPRSPADLEADERTLRDRLLTLARPEQLKTLRDHLRRQETDVTAMRLLGRLEFRGGDAVVARSLYERAVDLAPGYEAARADLAQLLLALNEPARAAAHTARLVAAAPANLTYQGMRADALGAVGDLQGSIAITEALLRHAPRDANLHCAYAQALHFAGRRADSVRAFRASLALQPGMGMAYWGLAELRGDFLTDDDVAAMRAQLSESGAQNPHNDGSNRMLLQYALGQALEQRGDFAESFAAYQAGAALAADIAHAEGRAHNAALHAEQVRRRRDVFGTLVRTAPTAGIAPSSMPAGTPIFVIGMPRSGSTLVEQILASHSQVEATLELPVLGNIVRDLAQSRRMARPDVYPECVRGLSGAKLAALGARYLHEAAAYRRTDRPYFIDKQPRNWLEAGLIRLILPHAKIIDIRREKTAACFAMYKQMLAEAEFSYDFTDLAEYYTSYTGLLDHFAEAMPGFIHMQHYERLVDDTEAEIRRLLAHCGLQFEPACLRFWDNDRAVATPSAEQVRRPIFRQAMAQWRNFEPWLEPLQQALRAAEAAASALPQPDGYELGLTLAAMSVHDGAIDTLRGVTAAVPNHPGAWRNLGALYRLNGQDKQAEAAAARAASLGGDETNWAPGRDPRKAADLDAAERALQTRVAREKPDEQAEWVRQHLYKNPLDAAAMRVLARLEWQDGDEATSVALMERALEVAPGYNGARAELAVLLMSASSFGRALQHTSKMVQLAPHDAELRAIHVDALKCVGDFAAAISDIEALLREQQNHPRFLYGYGQALHYAGRAADSAAAYRKCLQVAPTMGEAYWGLADLKRKLLTADDVAAIRAHLAGGALSPSARMHMRYALGHALEIAGDYAGSFAAYQEGARLFRGASLGRGIAYTEAAFVDRLTRLKRVFTQRALAARTPPPPAPGATTPIFVVGMPRAGSTLVEQILASHGMVEGTRELPVIGDITRDLALSRRMVTPSAYPECLLDMSPAQLAELGERCLQNARLYRATELPYYVDKRPWNWLEVGLIHMILPQAKIIDIRREPMSACFAMFKQVLPAGADFSYDLRDLGQYYNGYVNTMRHFDAVLPGRVLRVEYERLVADTETEVRRILEYCGLPFDPACLRFWETERAVSTPSAEQVRRPIFKDAVAQWRNYEPWLGPLKESLAKPPVA